MIRGMRGAIRAGLVLLVAVVFGQTVRFEFVALDDPGYVAENEQVLSGLTLEGLRWAATTTAMGNWHPLTWLSLMLDAEIGGPAPAIFHLTNVLLHAANTLLLFGLLERATGDRWPSVFVAALFAVHPLHVESVAWVAERKDVLSTLFWLLATLAYVRWVERPSAGRYALVLAALAAGLAAKPMLVTLPITLLLLDAWPLASSPGRTLRRRAAEKLPLFVLSAAAAALALWAQARTGAVAPVEAYPLGTRVANAVVASVRYACDLFWPAGLAVPYPYDAAGLTPLRVGASAALLAAVTALALTQARRRPYLLVGWLWYLVTLAPVIGLVQVGEQGRADRYTYVPLIGLFVMIAWSTSDSPLARHALAVRRVLAAAGAAAVALLAALAWVQTSHWRNSETLFTHALRVTEDNKTAHQALGLVLHRRGALEEAMAHYREALRISPTSVESHRNLAAALGEAGRHAEALEHHRAAVRLAPDDDDARAGSPRRTPGSAPCCCARVGSPRPRASWPRRCGFRPTTRACTRTSVCSWRVPGGFRRRSRTSPRRCGSRPTTRRRARTSSAPDGSPVARDVARPAARRAARDGRRVARALRPRSSAGSPTPRG
jgi:tetratricopeptide (TPR) repeat protein